MRIVLLGALLSAGACTFGSTGASGSGGPGMPQSGTEGGASPDTSAGPAPNPTSAGTGAIDAGTGADDAGSPGDAETAASTTGVPDPPTSTDDAGTSATSDETTSGAPVLPVGPFGTPVAIAELNSDADDDDPSVTADELFIVFNSARSGASEIWWSEREAVEDAWDPPQLLDDLAGGYITGPSVTPDGLVLLWSTNLPPSLGLDVWMSTRADRSASFGPAERVQQLASDTTDIAPRWFPQLGIAWLCSDRAGSVGETDPWIASWPLGDTVPSGTVEHVPALATTAADCAVGLSADGREAFVETTRPGGAGSWDLWRVYRDDPEADFLGDELQPALELNTAAFDIDPWPSADGHRLYMASDRDGGLDLFVASRDE